jgi:hypothetical protein
MKTTLTLLLAGIMTAFFCSIGNAQISYSNSLVGATLIYSNAFNGGAVNITNTPPNYAVSLFGGTNNAVWIDAGGSGDTNALYANGVIGTGQGDSWLLPFKARTNYVYTLTATVNFTGNPGSWVVAGFAQNYSVPGIANSAPNGNGVNGYDWTLRNFTGNTEFFAGAAGGANVYNSTPAVPTGAGIYTYTQILDTTSNKWVITALFNGAQLGAPYTYASTPTIGAIMIGQHALANPSAYQWTSLTLSAAPIVVLQQPVSANVNVGTAFTNTVVVAATSPSYQWYKNDAPIVNATNSSLIFNSASPSDGSTNYYVVVTNNLGSVTSSVASLTVYTNPVFMAVHPVAYTNPITLFGGNNVGGTNYVGSRPTFSVSVMGASPLTYEWLTNGVAVGGATNASFTFTNCQMDSPTTFACIVSNSYGEATNTWSVSYVQTPTAPYPQALLATQPLGYWRLNEAEVDENGDNGVLALDYGSGNNGIYTNVYLGNSGYSSLTDPDETSVQFFGSGPESDAFAIQGINFAAPTNTSAAFSVEAWVNNGIATEPANAGIVAKGYGGAEEFALYVNGGYQFLVRDAAGNLHTATSTIVPNGTWQHLVGVCDEANSNLTLYVNGTPAGSAALVPGSGLLATGASVPMTIGAKSSSPTVGHNDQQYRGFMNDVAVHNYALSAAQVASLFAAPGNPIPVSFVPPIPPTNVVYQANTTLTISATVYGGAPPIGYYWTNLTTGGVLASGITGTVGNLNATLTIPNASGSLSGDQLELVATNAISSTNLFVNLFSPAPPVALEYPNPILYSNYFNGGTWSIAGMPATAANSLVGGINTTWVDALGTNDTGNMPGSGVDASTLGDSWMLPFTPHSGYIYTETASLTFSGYPGNWVGVGFAQTVTTNSASGYGRFSDGGTTPPQQGPNGYNWIILSENTGNVQYFAGPGGSGAVTNQNGFFTANVPGTHTVRVVLDTTGPQWIMYAFVDGVSAGTNTYAANPPIGAVGFTQNTLGTPANVQWNSFALSQEAPGGVPPYLLAPLPPTNSIVLTNATVTIPATAFGSAPLGYYWSNNSTVIASGLTNNMAPVPANLSVSSGSLSAGQLELVVTNAYGTSITVIRLVSPVNPNPTNIVFSATGNQLTLSWPLDHAGWTLQAQTNAASAGLGTNWVDVVNSTSTNQVTIPIDSNNGSVFYRLKH